MIHLPPHILHVLFVALIFAAAVFAGRWLERRKYGQNPPHAPASGNFCPHCGAKLEQAGASRA
jgi:hypothetical protein